MDTGRDKVDKMSITWGGGRGGKADFGSVPDMDYFVYFGRGGVGQYHDWTMLGPA